MRDPLIVDENTTQADLEFEYVLLGITHTTEHRWSSGQWSITVSAVLYDLDGMGVGVTKAEALNDALAAYRRQRKRVAEEAFRGGARLLHSAVAA